MDDNPLVVAIEWFAAGTGVTAAFLVSLDLGRRMIGFGFIVFVASSLAWIVAAFLSEDGALGAQNGVLFAINIFGVYRYLIRKKPAG